MSDQNRKGDILFFSFTYYFYILFIYLWLCWVFIAVRELSLRFSGFLIWGSSCGAWAQRLWLMGLVASRHTALPRLGIKRVSPALGRFLSSGPPGKSLHYIITTYCHRKNFIVSIHIPIPKKGSAKEYSTYHTIALISHASKVILKILQARLQQYVNRELPDVQAGFRKGRGTRDQFANIRWIIKKQESSRKTSISALLTMPKICLVKAMVFPVVMYRCESWTIKKAERWRIDAFELWCCRRFLRVPGLHGNPTSPS